MDPFTEKLLERTRARRENLQKKLSERPAAAGAKRLREPLGETNSLLSCSAAHQVPQVSTKPSSSKRQCSGETLHPADGEENQHPAAVRSVVCLLSDCPTDKKPPLGPSGGPPRSSSSSSSSSSSARAALQPEAEPMVTSAPAAPRREVQEEEPAPSAAGMKSRLQRLMEQRRCWDGDDVPEADDECPPLSVRSRAVEVPAVVAPPTASSEAPLGRRGRLAHLAATIGSWEDDLSLKEKQGEPSGPGFTVPAPPGAARNKHGATSCSAAIGKQQTSDGGAPSKPQRTPASFQTPISSPSHQKPPASSGSPQKPLASSSGSEKPPASSSGPQKPPASSSGSEKPPASSAGPQKPPASSSGSEKAPASSSSPQKPPASSSGPQKPPASESQKSPISSPGPQKPSASSTSVARSPPTGLRAQMGPSPAVKSFLERFEEQVHHSPSTGRATQTRTPSGSPSTRLLQDRLRPVNTSTADLTQRQKLEREAELALIRNRFQKGSNIWKSNDKQMQNKTSTDHQAGPAESSSATQEPTESEETMPESVDEPTTKTYSETTTGTALSSPPVCSSSPSRSVGSPEDRPDQGKRSITSAIISQLFEGVLDQTEEEEEEEDALNISSMSLLAPLTSVVTSPDRRLMTSTPAHSFLLKNHTPDRMSRPTQVQETLQVQETSQVQETNQVQETSQVHSSSSDSVETCEDDLRLPYSIDAYRSTRLKETERPNIKQVIVRKEDVSQRAGGASGAGGPQGVGLFNVKQKMKVLSSEMNLQQTVIHQASQALNCCTDEEHGKGSEVEAEAERLLLVATERREALKSELDCLRGRSAVPPNPTLASRGSISLQELRLPLKADFVCSTANRPDSTRHSFFILLRSGAERIVATPLASTHRGLSGDTLTFSTQFTLPDASSDFEIHMQVYCLVQKREPCTDKKKRTNKSKAVTPKRFLPITRTAHTPVVASPGGPHAVRTSNFILVGSHKLNLSAIGKNKFPLEKVPFLCPLEGHVFLRLQCEVNSRVEERGFLTMFEDVSGFGAWHRRWCVLSGYSICYWTYPDDERRKSPIGRINLASCTSRAVEPASREFCARPNTLELITARPQREDDKETLVSQCTATMCVTKNWLSADTKDERNLWMKKLNQILTDLRMWQPDACSRPQ